MPVDRILEWDVIPMDNMKDLRSCDYMYFSDSASSEGHDGRSVSEKDDEMNKGDLVLEQIIELLATV